LHHHHRQRAPRGGDQPQARQRGKNRRSRPPPRRALRDRARFHPVQRLQAVRRAQRPGARRKGHYRQRLPLLRTAHRTPQARPPRIPAAGAPARQPHPATGRALHDLGGRQHRDHRVLRQRQLRRRPRCRRLLRLRHLGQGLELRSGDLGRGRLQRQGPGAGGRRGLLLPARHRRPHPLYRPGAGGSLRGHRQPAAHLLHPRRRRPGTHAMTAPVRTLRHALILLALLWAGAANALLMMSEAKEQEIGKTLYDQITAEMPIYPDQKVTDYVNTLGQKLVAHSDKPEGKFTFTVIDNGDINAFATPGGYIYIHRGLLAYLRSEAQLAAVLAHEIAHVTARHSARQQRAQTGSNVAAGLLAILSRSGEVGEATALWGAATVRGYGREMELEADGLGAQTMARAGYDRNAIIEVLGMLKDHERFEKQRAREAGREPQTYHGLFATHPRNDRRLAEIVASGATQSGGERGEIPFRIATDGLVWGRNTQSTPERENRYIDRDRAFRIDHPPGWTLSRTASGLTATAPGSGDGFTLEILPRTV